MLKVEQHQSQQNRLCPWSSISVAEVSLIRSGGQFVVRFARTQTLSSVLTKICSVWVSGLLQERKLRFPLLVSTFLVRYNSGAFKDNIYTLEVSSDVAATWWGSSGTVPSAWHHGFI